MTELLTRYGAALDRCAFCHDQCMSATPEVVVTGDQSLVVSRVANLIRLADEGRLPWSLELARRLFFSLTDQLQFHFCLAAKEEHHFEPFLRAARAEAVRRNVAPAAVMAVAEHVRLTGNVFGCHEQLPDPVKPADGAPVLLHDAATRLLTPGALAAARELLTAVGPVPGELALPSGGMVEFDLGLCDLAQAAAGHARAALAAFPTGPVVTVDPVLALAMRTFYPQWNAALGRPVLHISEYLAERSERLPDFRRQDVTVTYHDPGALARGLAVTAPPRTLLERIPGLRLVEPVTTGTYARGDGPLPGYPDPSVAAAISRARFAELRATGADLIVTTSPYSVANLKAVANGVPVYEWAEFIRRCC